MKNPSRTSSVLVGFFVGMLMSFLVGGAAAVWYFMKTPSAPVSLPSAGAPVQTSPTAAPQAEVSYPAPHQAVAPQSTSNPAPALPKDAESRVLSLDGDIILPPLLQDLLRNEKGMLISVRAFVDGPTAKDAAGQAMKNLLRIGDDLHVESFPYHYHLTIRPNAIGTLAQKHSINLYVWAKLCYARDAKASSAAAPVGGPLSADCTNDTVPSIWGWLIEKVTIPAAPAKPTEEVVQVPPVVLRRLSKKFDPVACERTGGTISGRIQATPAFLKAGPLSKKYVLVAAPTLRRPPAPFTFQDDSIKLTAADVAQGSRYGIVRQIVTIRDATPVPFKISVPEPYRNDVYTFLVSGCKDGQSDDDCAAAAFPITAGISLTRAATVTRLIPGGFEQARCGMKDHLFYLHHANPDAPRATEATVYTSNPPELIEGAGF